MDFNYTAKLVCCGKGAAVSFSDNCSFLDFCKRVRDRYPDLNRIVFKLRFTIHPDVTVYQLENDIDMKILCRLMSRYNSDLVDVDVLYEDSSVSGLESVVSNNYIDESSVLLEENQYLGCYTREEPKVYRTHGWESFIHSVGQIFEGGVEDFRLKLRMYAVEVGFDIQFLRNNKETVAACCSKKVSDGCGWFVKASLCRFNGFFQIMKLVNEHSCCSVIRLQSSRMMGSKIIKYVMLDKLRENPNKTAADVCRDLKTDFGIDVPYRTAWYGKERAREAVIGDEGDSYSELVWFCERTVESNPGSRIELNICSETKSFQRMFVCYSSWMNGFLSCRPLLFIDATFITNKYQGQLIAATAKDGNQGMYPVAYAIVDSESEINWTFFLQCLSEELARYSTRRVTFVSDRNSGLLSAYPKVFPNNPLGFCFRHLLKNLTQLYPKDCYLKQRIPQLFMSCAYSRTPDMYESNMALLRAEGGKPVEDFLKDLPKESWCVAFFNGDRFGEMTSNLAECFNNWVLPLKCLPIVEMNEGIRVKNMEMISSRKEEVKEWFSFLCPKMEKKLKENLAEGRHWKVSRSDTNLYEVHCQKYRVIVNLATSYCSCGEWSCHGFPCSHGLVVMQNAGASVYSYVTPFYQVEKYRQTYSYTINPVSSIAKPLELPKSSIFVQPPFTRRPPGRPKKQRFRSKDEVLRKQIKCGRCGKYGRHNRTSCKDPI